MNSQISQRLKDKAELYISRNKRPLRGILHTKNFKSFSPKQLQELKHSPKNSLSKNDILKNLKNLKIKKYDFNFNLGNMTPDLQSLFEAKNLYTSPRKKSKSKFKSPSPIKPSIPKFSPKLTEYALTSLISFRNIHSEMLTYAEMENK